ncbi:MULTISPECIES: SDR family oxidoreductase [unclassified Bacillus (in: firmicutes)]|uniref:SDR family oxidoreductase n=1 Tax=unclassified Bacillus (in: firmicutes) TaxID=185979 RepID=UPI00232DC3A1|nr:SDR family oxidoreductase [Bacillus sp. BP-3]MDC2863608.1 SDR family oxidoreductase [Bacillus sp. BP-3]
MTHVQNKVALITGVSSPRGIGAAICRELAFQGIDIFFTHWQSEASWPETFQKEILELGVRCDSLEMDLSDANAAFTIMDTVSKQFGPLLILVNNAAYSTEDGYAKLDAHILDNHYAVNMRATFLLCVEFARRFEQADLDGGRIINMTSGQELGPMIGELAYAATKGAIAAFTKSLSAEVAHLGITVNAVNPGPTDSTWMTDEIRKHLLPKFLMGRIGTPEDAARLVAFLASDDAKWITGQVMNSEGGFLRS